MRDSKFLGKLVEMKVLWLVYFAGGTFIYMMLDMFMFKQGALDVVRLWQMILLAILLTVTQVLFYDIDGSLVSKKRMALHVLVNYIMVLCFGAAVGVIAPLSVKAVLIYTAAFAVVYAGLLAGFVIYYMLEREKLNGTLARLKSRND